MMAEESNRSQHLYIGSKRSSAAFSTHLVPRYENRFLAQLLLFKLKWPKRSELILYIAEPLQKFQFEVWDYYEFVIGFKSWSNMF